MMDLFSGGFLGSLIPFLVILTVVVFFHELGHFWVGRLCGVKVETFSVGFGPELFAFNDKRGTRWRFAIIPLGGYVKFLSDGNAASLTDQDALDAMDETDRKQSFAGKTVYQRAAIVAAGPAANFLLAIVIFAGIFMAFGRYETIAKVDGLVEGGAAAQAGFEVGDVITAVDGNAIRSFSDVQRIVSASAQQSLEFVVDRNGVPLTLQATPEWREVEDGFGSKMRVGILGISRSTGPDDLIQVRFGPVEAVTEATSETWFIITRTLSYVAGIFTGEQSTDQLGGPIRIAMVSGQAAAISWVTLANLAAFLSVSIGLINLFPVPVLDGGHLVFYAFEAIRGRPLSMKVQEMSFRIGMALILLLMVFTTWNDIAILPILNG